MFRALVLLSLAVSTGCAKSAEEWQRDLDNADPFVRGMAAIGMGLESPRAAATALPVLLKTIDRKDVGLDHEAALALIEMGPFHAPVLLRNLVEDQALSDDRRSAIKYALVAAGPGATGGIVQCMRGPGIQRVGDLGDVLLQIGEPAIPAIVEMLVDEQDLRLRKFAAYLLARFGPVARSALPALRAARDSPDPDLRSMAQKAIERIQEPAQGNR